MPSRSVSGICSNASRRRLRAARCRARRRDRLVTNTSAESGSCSHNPCNTTLSFFSPPSCTQPRSTVSSRTPGLVSHIARGFGSSVTGSARGRSSSARRIPHSRAAHDEQADGRREGGDDNALVSHAIRQPAKSRHSSTSNSLRVVDLLRVLIASWPAVHRKQDRESHRCVADGRCRRAGTHSRLVRGTDRCRIRESEEGCSRSRRDGAHGRLE